MDGLRVYDSHSIVIVTTERFYVVLLMVIPLPFIRRKVSLKATRYAAMIIYGGALMHIV